MSKKYVGIVIVCALVASVCHADGNPFLDGEIKLDSVSTEISSEDTAEVVAEADDSNLTASETVSATEVTSATETATATATANSTETKSFEYTVVAGDCLSAIAERYLGDISRWPELVEANKDKYPSIINNPNLIYIGWQLTIPGSSSTTDTQTTTSTATSKEIASVNTATSTSVNTTASVSNSTKTSTAMTTSTSTAKSTTTTASKNSSGATITANDRVLHIGDSHSCGVYGKTIDGLMRETGAKVNTVAVAGSSPTWWMNGTTGKCGYYSKDENGNVTEPYWQTPMQTPKLQSLIDEYKPSVLVVSLGANMVGYSESSIRSQIQSICDKAQAANCKLVWVGPPDSRSQDNAQVNTLYTVLKSEIAKYDGTLVDSRQYTEYPASGGDGLHYSGTEGTAKAKTWANSVMTAIQKK